jgi:hypothetical protein
VADRVREPHNGTGHVRERPLFRLQRDNNWFRFTTSDVQPSNAFDEIQAENYDSSASVTTSTVGVIAGSGSITATQPGGYTCYKDVYFGNGASAVDSRCLSAGKAATREFELRVDNRTTGAILDTVVITDTSTTWRAKFAATASAIPDSTICT